MAEELIAKRKYCLLGEGAVGKTSLIRRFVTDQFDDRYITTIGTKVTKKSIHLDNPERDARVDMMIWDIMGQQGYRGMLQESYFHGASGGMAVCDVTRPETLENLQEWINGLRGVCGDVPIVILANKADLKGQYEFERDELLDKSRTHNARAFLTSAKTGQNVERAFFTLGQLLLQDAMKK